MAKNKPAVIYLDSNASSELSNDVASVIMDIALGNFFGNPSSLHTQGKRIKNIINAARNSVAASLGAEFNEILFTSGGTEANNIALRGVCNVGDKKSQQIVISAGEHSSVHNTAEFLAGEEGVRFIPLTPQGNLDLEWAARLITEDTSLVSVMLANNETGAIFQIKEIVDLAHSRGVLVHCDAVQAYGKIPIDVKDLGVDLLSISGHKAHALPGIGALYVRKGVLLHPIFTGGNQEGGLRPGTENYIGIASLGTVADDISYSKPVMSPGLRNAFEKGLLKRVPNIVINGYNTLRVPNTSSVTFKGIHSLSMLAALGERGVYASAGSACSSGSVKPSRTLLAMGLSNEDALSTVRFSFSNMSSMIDAALAINYCVDCAELLRSTEDKL